MKAVAAKKWLGVTAVLAAAAGTWGCQRDQGSTRRMEEKAAYEGRVPEQTGESAPLAGGPVEPAMPQVTQEAQGLGGEEQGPGYTAAVASSLGHAWYDWTAMPIDAATNAPAASERIDRPYLGTEPAGSIPGSSTDQGAYPGGSRAEPAPQPSGMDQSGAADAGALRNLGESAQDLGESARQRTDAFTSDTFTTDADQALGERIRAALDANALTTLAGERIHLGIDQGMVTVTGTVADARQRANVAEVIAHVAGLGQVRDQLSVRPAPPQGGKMHQ